MSKRGADEYITKENGSISNVGEDSKVKMATAAQLAKRKMAAPKGRLNRGGTPTGSSQPTSGSNPFASSFGGSGSQQQSMFANPGGMTFGESKSFPSGASATNGDFTFSVPASSSFTFGQPNQQINNPFAGLNGSTTQQTTDSSEDAMMESPQKKPFNSLGFGSASSGVTNGNIFAGFGQSTQQEPPKQPLFAGFAQSGVNGSGSSTPNSSFGQDPPSFGKSESPPSNPFAQAGFSFGQNSMNNQSDSHPTTTFGQTQPQASSSRSSAPTFSFGQASQSQPTTSTPQKLFDFGQTSQPKKPEPSVSQPAFQFGQTAPSNQSEPQALKPSFSFGQSTPSSQPLSGSSNPTSQSSTTSTLFGMSQQAGATNNPFAGLGGVKSSEETSSPEPRVFGQSDKPSSDNSQSNKTNSFAGFGNTNKANDLSSTSSASSLSANGSKAVFDFSSPTQSNTAFSFGKSGGEKARNEPAQDSTAQPLFGFSSSQPSKPLDMFSPPKAAAGSSSSIFGKQAEQTTTSNTATKNTPLFSFGSSTNNQPKTDSSTSVFGAKSSTSAPSATSSITEDPRPSSADNKVFQAKAKDVGESATASTATRGPESTTQQPAGLFSSKGAPPVPAQPTSRFSVPDDTPAVLKRAVYSNPPARIPAYLDAENYKSYDSNYRLHSLNREFQRRIASLDPSKNDFENIMRSYVAARESIGESIGLYTRNIAGTKRKTNASDEQQEDHVVSKKARQTEVTATDLGPSNSPSTGSAFQPVSSPAKSATRSDPLGAMDATSQTTPARVSTSSLFKSMIPESNKNLGISTEATPGQQSNTFTASAGAASLAKPSSLFGSVPSNSFLPTSNVSTTPPSSPPKTTQSNPPPKPILGMPKFSAPATGTNFFSAFAKKSEESTAKLAREMKEKRKLEEFDSDEDDEAQWEKKYEEEEKAKRAKVSEVAPKGFVPSFGKLSQTSTEGTSQATDQVKISNGESSQNPVDISDNDASQDDGTGSGSDGGNSGDNEDDLPEDDVDDEDDESDDNEDETQNESGHTASLNNGKSLFERITRDTDATQDTTPALKSKLGSAPSSKSIFADHLPRSTPETPSFSPITPSTSQTVKPSKIFNFTPTPKDNPAPSPGASVFNGGTVRDGPIPGEGLFGSRTSSPVNGERPVGNVFGTGAFGSFGSSQTSSNVDHTWKRGSGIKFGTSNDETPSVNITAPSPKASDGAKPFSTLFGTSATPSSNGLTSSSLGFNFTGSSATPAPGFLGAASHLVPGSATSSAMSSRATSPGGTDNESVATDTEDVQDDPQASLMESRPGEENEEVLLEARARALKYYTDAEKENTGKATWNSEGLGPVRILKNRATGKSRIVLRADPGANIILNTNLLPNVEYVAKTLQGNNGGVNLTVMHGDKLESWMLRVKTRAIADEMVAILEKAKKPQNK